MYEKYCGVDNEHTILDSIANSGHDPRIVVCPRQSANGIPSSWNVVLMTWQNFQQNEKQYEHTEETSQTASHHNEWLSLNHNEW